MKLHSSVVITKVCLVLNRIDVTGIFKGKLTLNFLSLVGLMFMSCLQVAQAEVIDIDFNMVPLPNNYNSSTCWGMYTSVWNYFYKTELEDNSYVTNYVSTSSSPCIDPAALPPGPIAWSGGRIFGTFTKYKHATSVSVNAGSFCRLYVPNPAGGQDIATFSRPDAVLVGYTSDGRTVTARANQPVSSLITISAPKGTEFYKAEVYADQNSAPCSSYGTLFVSKIQIQTTNPDLAILTPIVVQNGSTTGSDGLQIVSTGSVQVKVPVSGSNLDAISSQSVAVMFSLSTQSPQVKYISVADIQSGTVRSVTFDVNLRAIDVGLETVSAIIAPGNVLNEPDFTNNAKSVQVHVESGSSSLQLAADFPELLSDPSYHTQIQGNSSSIQIPLGSLINLQLKQGSQGNMTSMLGLFSLGTSIPNPTFLPDEEPLFPNNVLIEYDRATPDTQKMFQAVHLGTTVITINPTNKAVSPVTVQVTVYDPGLVGKQEAAPDDLIVKYAHLRGIPPQLIKAIIRQESWSKSIQSVNQYAFRYEPGYDRKYIQQKTKSHQIPIINDSKYMPNELAISRNDQFRQGNLTVDDIAPRGIYEWELPDSESTAPISSADGCTGTDCITADNIVRSNSWANFKINPDIVDLDFTAQTTMASSYGYMQIMLQVAIEEHWISPIGTDHPFELFIPSENINVATQHFQKITDFTFDDTDPDVLLPAQLAQSFRRALQRYNGGNDVNYSTKVYNFIPQYRPLLTRPVFPN